MATSEVGHPSGRTYVDQDGQIHLNGGKIYTDENGVYLPGPTTDLVVNCTAATLSVSAAVHNGRIIVLDLAAGIAVTLPTAAAGLRFKFIIKTTFTGAATIKSATGADIMIGHALMGNNSDNTVVSWEATAASTYDTIDMFGTSNSTGGMAGQEIDIIGLAANLWYVYIRGDAAGTEATPFADTVT